MPDLGGYGVTLAPHLPDFVFALIAIVAVVILAFSIWRRARGSVARVVAIAAILLALANPMIVHESRESLTDVVALIIDRSQSQTVGTRTEDMNRAVAQLRERLRRMPGIEVREAEVRTQSDASDGGTNLFAAVNQALSEVPPDRVAGVISVTDGEVHDAPDPKTYALDAPFHVLLTGAPNEQDRKLTVVRTARFGIVGQEAEIVVRVDDFGGETGAASEVAIRIDGESKGSRLVVLGSDTKITVPVAHGGENVVEIEAAPGPAEQTLQNNRAVVAISGVRDRLRVLLVSGEPHAGERVWRNLLKADPSVDLVHFTILRPPDKQDGTPINELSLIAFPKEELFNEKLDQFDLVIFDRYQNRDILPLAYFENIARYVENGGALLLSSGPEFAAPASIYRTPLSAVLPAQPTGTVFTQPFKPDVTAAGLAHPVTQGLPQANASAGVVPTWGRWFRMLGTEKLGGVAVMEGPGARPLLVLDRVRQGRVAQLLSDQAWLWARGFEGGGPQAELLRRLAHWLMKEPDLEEERLSAEVSDGQLNITRRTMADHANPVTVTKPSGGEAIVTPTLTTPGVFRAHVKADELGLYRMTDGTLSAVAAAGPLNPREVADMRATDSILAPFAKQTGGGVAWIKDGVPSLRQVSPGDRSAGDGWFGIARRGAYRVTSLEQEPLLPPWLALVLVLGTLLWAWRRESK